MKQLIIGTRGSALALWQANEIKRRIEAVRPELEVSLRIFKTKGDHILDRPLSEVGGKGLFTRELEDAMLAGEIQIAVHSLKDMPTQLPDGLILGAIPNRADVRDVLIFRAGLQPDELKVIGTSSLRRECLARRRWPGAEIVSIRGNVQTRMGRVHEEPPRQVDGVLLAMAGILRLELNQEEGYDYLPLNPESWIPAVSQGALAVECREDDAEVRALLAELNHAQTAMCVRAERAFLSAVEGDCRVPVGASVTADGSSLRIRGFIGSPDGVSFFEGVKMGDGAGEGAEALGQALARELLDAGGAEVLQALRAEA